jgi:predicted ATPase/class 3 adenylate cyclase
VTNIEEWLASIGLEQYAPRFVANAIDLSVVRDVTEQDLKELDVLIGHRRKFMRAVAELDRSARPPSQSTAAAAPRDEAERRQITVMFCDLVDSTALSARLDAEDLRAVIGVYQSCIAGIVNRRQGTIARYMGDGVLIYFGYPRAHEDDAEQATRAGLDVVDAVANLPIDVDATLQVRVGIATGTVIVGDLIGEGASQEQAVVGQTPNLAASLQTLATPNTVLISAETHRLTRGHFEYRSVGPVKLKGWTEPISAWQVLGPTDVASRFEAEHKTRLLPPLGRDEEIELLLRRWQQATLGEGRVVVLTGEPGIGKSHIALALMERLRSEPHIRLRYYCSAHHTNSALFPFVNQLERAAGFKRSDRPAEKFAKLEALLARSTANSQHVAVLANLLSLPTNEHYPVLPEMTPQKRKETTLAALLAQFNGLTTQQPVFAIFEDVHWIDPTSLELLAMTVEQLPQMRGLLIVTTRPEFTPPWPGHAYVTTLPLTRLGRRDGAALVERVTAGKPLPEEVMQQILARTDGVPLFVEELTKTVLESGQLQEQNGQYVLDRPLPSLAIPTTLHASLMARLDRLAPVREVAQIGAVVGREFSYELLSAAAGLPQERLEEALNELVRAELVFRRGEIPQAIYSFKHALVRDAAYAGLLKNRRIQLHSAIATAFEQQFPEIVEAQPEMLAHHLMEAGLIESALGYWLKAGRNAAMRSANLEAIAHLQRGIGAVGRLVEAAGRDRLELDFLFALGPCLIAIEGPASSRAMAIFARARELCERLGDPPEYLQVMFWFATACVVRGELPQAEEMVATLLRLARARSDRPALLNAMRGQAMILLFMGRIPEAREAIECAVQAFDASDEPCRLAARAAGQDAGVANLALMSWTLWLSGEADAAVTRMAAAFERAAAIEHPHTRAYACYYASVLYALLGEPSIAQSYAERCVALSEEHGFRQWRGLSSAVRGTCASVLDPSSDTLQEVTRALEEYRSAGYQLGITALYVLLCQALLSLCQPDSAMELIEQGLSIARHNSERIFESDLYRLKARALLDRGASDANTDARTLLDQAVSTARRQQAKSLELRAARDLARLLRDQGKREEAQNLLAPVLASFTDGGDSRDLTEARGLLDQLR